MANTLKWYKGVILYVVQRWIFSPHKQSRQSRFCHIVKSSGNKENVIERVTYSKIIYIVAVGDIEFRELGEDG